MKKVTIKLISISIIIFTILGAPSLIYFILRGAESHFIPEAPIEVGYPFGTMAGGMVSSNATKEIAKDLGIRLGRMDISWSGVEKSPGVFDFSHYDLRIGNLTEMNISLLAVLNYDNNAVEDDPQGKTTSKYIAPSDVPKFIKYVNQTISHYFPIVKNFEIWNEPNLPLHWLGPWSDFFYLFEETIKFIKTNFPDVFIVAPAVSDMGHAFLSQLFQEGYLQQCDAISFHTYHQYNEALIYRIWQLRDLCKMFNFTGELWLTEAGFPTGGTYLHVIDEQDQGDRLIKSISLALALGIDKEIWYTFKDGEHDEPYNSESYFGLLFNDLSYKTGAYAIKFFNEFCTNSTLRTDLVRLTGFPSKKNLFAFLYQQEDLTSTLVVWYSSSLVANEKIRIHLDLPAVTGTVISHAFDNSSEQFTQNSIKLGYTALVLTFTASDSESVIVIKACSSGLSIFSYVLMSIGIAIPSTILILQKFKPQFLDKNKRFLVNSDSEEKNY